MPNRNLNVLLSLAPMPMFFAGAIYSYFFGINICSYSGIVNEMLLMWIIMGIAHISPWLAWWEQRKYQKIRTLPVKQQ
jgi:hypothetical protein